MAFITYSLQMSAYLRKSYLSKRDLEDLIGLPKP